MSKLDLRQIGTIYGLPIYVDTASIPYHKDKDSILSNRDHEELRVTTLLQELFQPTHRETP